VLKEIWTVAVEWRLIHGIFFENDSTIHISKNQRNDWNIRIGKQNQQRRVAVAKG
jgi:hypothetical protein